MLLIAQVLRLSGLSLWAMVRLRVRPRDVLEQFHEAGVRSALFVAITLAFVGMVGVYQSAANMVRVLPEFSALGGAVIHTAIREMGPIMAGLLLATRVGTGMAAEIGSMAVTDQLDAMKLSSVDPVEHLVVPRFIASTVACLTLAVLGCVVGILAGMMVAYTGYSVLPDTFLSFRFMRMSDLWMGVTKSLVFGGTIPLVACACGFEATGGSEGVGRATTRAVVLASFFVIVEDACISLAWELWTR